MSPFRVARHILSVVASMSIVLLVGCSTQVRVAELPQDLAPGAAVDGLPFRARERYQIVLYRLVEGRYEPVEIKETTASLANQDHLYVLRVKGSPLSDGTVTVKLRGDNTMEKLKIESKSKGQDALNAVSTGIKDLADARATKAKGESDALTATKSGTAADEDSRVAALDAQQAAELAGLELDALPSDSTALQRKAAEQKLVKAKVVANQKARRAGLPMPFPDAGS